MNGWLCLGCARLNGWGLHWSIVHVVGHCGHSKFVFGFAWVRSGRVPKEACSDLVLISF